MKPQILGLIGCIVLTLGPLTSAAPEKNSDLERAQALFAAGKYREAADAFTQVIAQAPNDSLAYRGRGQARVDLKDFAGGITDYDRALVLDPQNARTLNLRGIAKKDKGDLPGALADYNRAIELDPHFAPPLANRAFLRNKSGDTAGALADYTHALEIAPKDEYALVGRAQIRIGQGDNAGALADCSTAIAANPKNASAHFNRGLAREKTGDRAGALEDFKNALALDPTMATAKIRVTALQTAIGPAAAPAGAPLAPTRPVQPKAPDALPPWPAPTLPPPGSPALSLPARLDINLVSATQFTGDVSATVEAMRAIQGPLSDENQKKFEAKWAPFFSFPATECVEYFKKLNPLLQEYLHLRAAVPGITMEMAAAWREAAMLSAYKNEVAVRETLGEARAQEQLLQGVNARMAEIMRQVDTLGDPPDATQAKARIRKKHDDAVAVVQQTLPTFNLTPTSQSNAPGKPCVFTPQAKHLPAGLVLRWDFGDGKKADTPMQPMEHTYAKDGEFTVSAQLLDGKTHAVLTTAVVKAKITSKEVKGVWTLRNIDRVVSGSPKSTQAPSPGYPSLHTYDASSSTNGLHYHYYDNDHEAETYVTTGPTDLDRLKGEELALAKRQYDGERAAGKISARFIGEKHEFAMKGQGLDTTIDMRYEPPPKVFTPGEPLNMQATFARTITGSPKITTPGGVEVDNALRASSQPMTIWIWSDPALIPAIKDYDVPDPQHYDEKMRSVGFLSGKEMPHSTDNAYEATYDPDAVGTQTVTTKKLLWSDASGNMVAVEQKYGKVTAPAGKLGQIWRLCVRLGGDSLGLPESNVLMVRETYYYVFQPESTAPAEVAVTEHTEEAANQYRIDEIRSYIANIDENISRLRAERATAKDPSGIDYQIMQAQTEKLAEQDAIASLQTGHDVHTRSPFDDYAHQTFVANIREEQLVMAEAQREVAALYKFVEIGDDRDGMRDFIQRELVASGAISRGDFAAIRKVANALNNRVVGYWQGEQAKSEEKAINAEENIHLANSAITACTIVASGGMSEIGAVYAAPSWVGTAGTITLAGSTGYVSTGSPKEALKQGIAWSCTIGNVATSMYDGYQDGGGWKGALTGAGQGLAIGWLTGKASEIAVAKLGSGPSFKTLPVRERPPTVGDFINSREFRQAQEAGKSRVRAFEDAQAQLQEAGQGGAAAERIKELQDVVKARANEINADQHAKMFLLKSGQGSPASIRAYESYHSAIHAEVEARFHEIMEKDMGFNPQEVAPVRNATSTGTAGMDYDLALKEGRLITKDGKPSSVSEWQDAAKEAYKKAFEERTGHSAEAAWENVTSSVHVESYKDIGNTPGKFEGWLTDLRNPENVKTLKSKFAEQATDVTRVKAWDFQNNKTMGEFSKLQEICRGTAKDMKTKLDPVLAVAKTSSAVEEEALRQARAHWKQVQEVMEDFGSNRIGPVTAKQKLYQLTGYESVHEIIDQMGVTMQGAVQWGR